MTTTIDSLSLGATDPGDAKAFYDKAFGLGDRLRLHHSDEPTTGFRGFVLSLVVAVPAVVDSFIDPALDAGAELLTPARRSFWGYGGVLRAPDGAIWKITSSSKKNTGAPLRAVEDVVMLIGAGDIATSKAFYTDHGFEVAKSFGRKYVEFAGGPITLALYGRKAAAKDAGVRPEGEGAHRIRLFTGTATFTDPDGFVFVPG